MAERLIAADLKSVSRHWDGSCFPRTRGDVPFLSDDVQSLQTFPRTRGDVLCPVGVCLNWTEARLCGEEGPVLVTSGHGGHPCYAAFRSNSQSTGNSARGAHPAARLAQRNGSATLWSPPRTGLQNTVRGTLQVAYGRNCLLQPVIAFRTESAETSSDTFLISTIWRMTNKGQFCQKSLAKLWTRFFQVEPNIKKQTANLHSP